MYGKEIYLLDVVERVTNNFKPQSLQKLLK